MLRTGVNFAFHPCCVYVVISFNLDVAIHWLLHFGIAELFWRLWLVGLTGSHWNLSHHWWRGCDWTPPLFHCSPWQLQQGNATTTAFYLCQCPYRGHSYLPFHLQTECGSTKTFRKHFIVYRSFYLKNYFLGFGSEKPLVDHTVRMYGTVFVCVSVPHLERH